ncbi:hypothetical protein Goklo_002630, partial [Gossypium klotzschianum]|nr:hypothetical protein [Gossypium klotzschianum]
TPKSNLRIGQTLRSSSVFVHTHPLSQTVGVHGSSPYVLLGDAVRTVYRPSGGRDRGGHINNYQKARKANEVSHTLATKRIRRQEETYLSNGMPVFAMIAVVEDRRWTNSLDSGASEEK